MRNDMMMLVLLAVGGLVVYLVVKEKPEAPSTTDRAPTGQESYVGVSEEGKISGTYYF